jgi:hypothetical protein
MDCCYLFEAKGVQRYILAGGRLLDIAGASDLLAQTVNSSKSDLLENVLDAVSFPKLKRHFSRRAAGSFMLHFTADIRPQFERFRALWRLAFSQHAPGLEFAEAFGIGTDAVEAKDHAYANASALRDNSIAALLPMAGPFAERSPRTALPGVETRDEEIVDEPTVRKRDAGRARDFAERFISEPLRRLGLQWPDEMEDDGNAIPRRNRVLFPFRGNDHQVAIIHADISGLGELYATASKIIGMAARSAPADVDAVKLAYDLSRRIESGVEGAAQEATRIILLAPLMDMIGRVKNGAVLPARPILLGGDDITIIVRADLAIPYASTLLKQIEERTALELDEFERTHFSEIGQFPIKHLSACAGIAIVKAKQPFHLALELAEGLCSYAKNSAKKHGPPFPSALAFHRITSSYIADNFDEIVRAEETSSSGVLTAQPYFIGDKLLPMGVPWLEQLKSLKEALNARDIKAGALRELRTLLHSESSPGLLSTPAYLNWRKVARGRGEGTLGQFDDALKGLGVEDPKIGVFRMGERPHTPLFDALEWSALA